MYVVKVGEFYVCGTNCWEIHLSKHVMKGYNKKIAENIAKLTNGEVIEMTEEVTNE